MSEAIDRMYTYFQLGEDKYLRVIPVTQCVITTNQAHALGIRDGMDHTIRMLSQYFDVVMRMKPYIEEDAESERWKVRTRFAIAPTQMPPGMKPRWIEIQSGSYEERLMEI